MLFRSKQAARQGAAGAGAAGAAGAASAEGAAGFAAFNKEGKFDYAAYKSEQDRAAKARADAALAAKLAAMPKAVKRNHKELVEARKVRDEAAFKAAKPTGIGKEFASAKSGGDGRKRGQKYDPFAYVALDPRMMNKRASQQTQAALFKDSFDKSTKKAGQSLPRGQRLKRKRVMLEGAALRK